MAKSSTLVLILFALSLLAVVATVPATAQAPEVIGWEMGISYIDDDEDNPFILDEDGDVRVEFWVRNDNLVGEITVSISYDNELGGSVDGTEEVSVSSGSNETFDADIKDVMVWQKSGDSLGVFEIRGELVSWGSTPAILPSIQNVEADLKVPRLYRLSVELEDIEHPVNSGTSISYTMWVENLGNSNDSVADVTLTDDCPLLSYDDTQGTLAEYWQDFGRITSRTSTNVVLDISSSHPGRICTIDVTVVSSGADSGGLGERTASDDTELDIKAGNIGSTQDNNDAGIGGDDGPDDPDEVVSSNFMPLTSLLAPASILGAAIARRLE